MLSELESRVCENDHNKRCVELQLAQMSLHTSNDRMTVQNDVEKLRVTGRNEVRLDAIARRTGTDMHFDGLDLVISGYITSSCF